MSSILIVVEGERFEKKVITRLFSLIGYEVIAENRLGNFDKYKLIKQNNVVYLIPGPKNDINSMMIEFDRTKDDLSKYFKIDEVVAENYLIYDIDTANIDVFNSMISKFNNPQEGMVVLSNPCIEVLADHEKKDYCSKPRDYKKHITKRLLDLNHRDVNESLESYIINNIISLLKKELNDNELLFGSNDIYDHVELSYKIIGDNSYQIEDEIYLYKNLFSVLYIVLSGVFKLYKYEDNSIELRKILKSYIELE